jgi:hypothetical protein
MPKIYLSPYHSRVLGRTDNSGCSKSYGPLHAALQQENGWPYDLGDDPSFFSRRHLSGPLTWGVCRPDARSQVQRGDVVAFFSFSKVPGGVEYRLSAIATVEHKISQADIFLCRACRKYRRYLNLLVRAGDRDGRRWMHHEPGAPERDWHKDWLSRIAPYRTFDKGDLKRQAARDEVTVGKPIGRKPFAFGENYVVFSADPRLTIVLGRPPLVAFAAPPSVEVWKIADRMSRSIFARTLAEARRNGIQRSLRIPRRPHPHSPPIRWELSPEALNRWRRGFIEFLVGEGLGELE